MDDVIPTAVAQPELQFGIVAKEEVPIESVIPYPGNARIHDMATIKGSLMDHGQVDAITCNRRTRRILGGNGTWTAMRELGWKTCHVDWLDIEEDEEVFIVLVLNRAPDLASYDWEAQAKLLEKARDIKRRKEAEQAGQQGLFDGFSEDDFEDVIAKAGMVGAVAIEDFRGDFQPGKDVTEHQTRAASAASRAAGMKEVVLILTPPQYDTMMAKIKELKPVWNCQSGSEVMVELISRAPEFKQ